MQKLVFNDSFAFGDVPLVSLADDQSKFRKSAARTGSSPVVAQWGKVDPVPGHALVHLLALGDFEKVGNNANGDAFEAWHVKEVHPTFVSHGALYKDHKSQGPKFGKVIKSAHNDQMGRTELLVAHEIDKCAEWLGKIEKNEPASYSMGYSCRYDECSCCGKKAAHRGEYCEHVKRGAKAPNGMNRILPDGRKCFVFNRKGHFNDISMVPVGADPTAFSLRKVAGLENDDETIGGAELAARYLQSNDDGAPDVAKTALARKLSMIEKRLQFAGIGSYQTRERTAELLAKTAGVQLRQAGLPELCAGLAKVGAVLPVHDFYALLFGPAEYAKHQGAVDKVARAAGTLFTELADDPDRLARVCANATFDAKRSPVSSLKRAHLDLYGRAFALDNARTEERSFAHLNKQGCNRDGDAFPPTYATSDAATRFLLDQYAAYKLAALVDARTSEANLLAAVLET